MKVVTIKEKERIKAALDNGESARSVARRFNRSIDVIRKIRDIPDYMTIEGKSVSNERIIEALRRGESVKKITWTLRVSRQRVNKIKKELKQAEQKPTAKSSTLPKTTTASTLTKDFVSTAWQKPLCETQPVVIIQYLKHLGYYGELHFEQVIELKKPND